MRDGGYGWPGCAVPHEGTHLHHLVEWQHGGATDLTNLGSCCERHHQMLHHGIGEARVVDGRLHVRLPAWLDPERRWLRDTFHQSLEAASAIAQQLVLALDLARAEEPPPIPADDADCWDRDVGARPPNDGRRAGPDGAADDG